MSTATPTRTTETTPREASLRQAVSAEVIRARHSVASRFAVVGLAVGLLQGIGWWSVSTTDDPDWFSLLGWQSLYATALLAPIVVLLAASAAARESSAREGGTWVRALSPARALVARDLVLAWQSLLLHAGLTFPILIFGLLGGLTDPPAGRFITLWLVLWAVSLLPLIGGYLLARRIGMISAVLLAWLWQIGGAVLAEQPHAGALPWTWGVRAAMPVLGIHQNAVRLEPGAAPWNWNPWWPALATAAVAVIVVAIAAVRATAHPDPRPIGRPRRRRRASEDDAPLPPARQQLSAAGQVTLGRRLRITAQLILLRATALPALVVAAVLGLVLVGFIWDATYVTGVTTWLLVPLGSTILAMMAWSAHAPGWTITSLRNGILALAGSLWGVCAAVLAVIVAAATAIAALSGGTSLLFAALALLTGLLVLTGGLWLSTRFGAGAAIGVTLVVLVISLVFGGTQLSDGALWLVGVLGWPMSAAEPGRAMIAIPLLLMGTAVSGVLWLRALRRAAAHG